jgi:6-phosphogluconolactonase
MQPEKKVFPNTRSLAEWFSKQILDQINQSYNAGNQFYMMLSGGSTPKELFGALARNSGKNTHWDHVHLYWGDERCVGPAHPESNYGMTRQTLLDQISIPQSNVHRIKGENDPESESEAYVEQLKKVNPDQQGTPVFDLILLGMGDDGHTASIFPDRMELLQSDALCKEVANPYSGQMRITVTPTVINNARQVVFMVTGVNKADVFQDIWNKIGSYERYPASYIKPANGKLMWLLDEAAAAKV